MRTEFLRLLATGMPVEILADWIEDQQGGWDCFKRYYRLVILLERRLLKKAFRTTPLHEGFVAKQQNLKAIYVALRKIEKLRS